MAAEIQDLLGRVSTFDTGSQEALEAIRTDLNSVVEIVSTIRDDEADRDNDDLITQIDTLNKDSEKRFAEQKKIYDEIEKLLTDSFDGFSDELQDIKDAITGTIASAPKSAKTPIPTARPLPLDCSGVEAAVTKGMKNGPEKKESLGISLQGALDSIQGSINQAMSETGASQSRVGAGLVDVVTRSKTDEVQTKIASGVSGLSSVEWPTLTTSMAGVAADIRTLTNEATKKGTLYTGDDATHKLLEELITAVRNGFHDLRSVHEKVLDTAREGADEVGGVSPTGGGPPGAPPKIPGGGGGGEPPHLPEGDARKAGEKIGDEVSEGIASRVEKLSISAILLKSVVALSKAFNPIDLIFGGLIKDEIDYMRNMRAIGYEIEGITNKTGQLQDKWQETGKVVERTGFNLSKFQQVYSKNLRRGIKSQAETVEVMKAGLNTATMLGMDAEKTADTFMEWHMHMNMNTAQINQINSGMRQVARNTGVTGQALAGAVEQAKQLNLQMRNAGTLTAASAKSMLELMAAGEKYGVADKVKEIAAAASSTTNFYKKASIETRALVSYLAAATRQTNELTTGRFMQTKQSIKDATNAFQDVVKMMGTTLEDIEAGRVDPETLRAVNLRLSGAFGIEAGEAVQIYKTWKEASLTYEDRMKEVTKELQSQNLTVQERVHLEEKARQLTIDQGTNILAAINEAGKSSKTLTEAMDLAAMKNKDMADDFRQMGVSLKDPVKAVQEVAVKTAQALKDAGGKDFTKSIKDAIGTGDMARMRDVMSQMYDAQQKLGVEQKKSLDPISELTHEANIINESLRNYLSPTLRHWLKLFIVMGVVVASLATIGATLMAIQATLGGRGLFGEIGKFFSKGGPGGGAGEAAADAAKAAIPSPVPEGLGGAGFKMPKLPLKEMAGFGKELLIGAAGMAVLAVGLVAIATAVIAISKGIMNLAGINVDEAAKTGLRIAELIMAAGAIALATVGTTAVLAAMGYLVVLGAKSQLLLPVAAAVGVGAAAMMVLIPALLAYVAGVLWVSDKILGSISKSAEEAAKSLAGLFQAAWMITTAVFGMAAKIAFLGVGLMAIANFAPGLLVGLVVGSAAMASLIPGMMLFATVIVTLARLTNLLAGADSAQAAAEAFTGVINAAWDISIAVMKLSGLVAVLGAGLTLLGVTAPILAGLLGVGALAIGLLMPTMTLFASTVVLLAQGLNQLGISGDNAITAAQGFTQLMDAAWMISKSVLVTAAKLAIVSLGLAALASLGPGVALALAAGADALIYLIPSMTLFTTAVVLMAKAASFITGGVSGATAAAEGMVALLDAAWSISIATLKLAAKLAVVGAGLLLLGGAAPLIVAALQEGAMAILLLAPGMGAFATALIWSSNIIGVLAGGVKGAQEAADGMIAVMDAAWKISTAVLKVAALLATIGSGMMLLGGFAPVIVAAMQKGATAIMLLTPSMGTFAAAVIFMSNIVGSLTGGIKGAKEAAEGMAVVLNSAWEISKSVLKMAATLAVVGAGLILLGGAAPIIAHAMLVGAGALLLLTPGIGAWAVAMVNIAAVTNKLGGADEAKEVADGLQVVLDSAWQISTAILTMAAKLALVGAGLTLLSMFAPVVITAMKQGAVALLLLTPGIGTWAVAMVNIAAVTNKLGGASEAQEVAEGLQTLLDSAWQISTAILKMSAKIALVGAGLSLLSLFAPVVVTSMISGAKALGLLIPGISLWAAAVVNVGALFAALGGEKEATEVVESLTAVLNGAWSISKSVLALATKLALMGAMSIAAVFIAAAATAGAVAFGIMSVPVFTFAVAMVEMGKHLADIASPRTISMISTALEGVADMCASVTIAMDALTENIIPMTKRSWFGLGSSPLEKLADATPVFQQHFENIMKFVVFGIMRPVQKVGNIKEIGSAVQMIRGMAAMLEVIPDIMDVLVTSVVPLAKGGWWSKAPMEAIVSAAPLFAAYFGAIAKFLRFGVVRPVLTYFPDKKEWEFAKVAMCAMWKILEAIPYILDSVSENLIPFVKPRWFSKTPAQKILQHTTKFADFFAVTSQFLRDGVIKPILVYLPNEKEWEFAKVALVAMWKILEAIPYILDSISANLIPFVKPKWFGKTPAQKLLKNTSAFTAFFSAVAKFLRDGVIKPILVYLPNKQEWEFARVALEAMAAILGAIPIVLDGISDKLIQFVRPRWFTQTPAEKLLQYSGMFAAFFEATSQFIRDGIIKPVMIYLPSKQEVEFAGVALTGMAAILKAIPLVLDEITGSLIPFVKPRWFTSTPAAKLLAIAPAFAEFFGSVSEFLRNGIVKPIMIYFPDAREVEFAGKAIAGMAMILKNIPPIMDELSENLFPMLSGGWFTKSPSQKILDKTSEFSSFFTAVSSFLRYGIMKSIFDYFPSPAGIDVAAKIVSGMSVIIASLPPIFDALSKKLFTVLDGGWFTPSEASLILKKKDEFAVFFGAVSQFIRDAIVSAVVDRFKDLGRLATAADIMKYLGVVISNIAQVIQDMAEKLIPVVTGGWVTPSLAKTILDKKDDFSQFFVSLSMFLNSLVSVILSNMPNIGMLDNAAKTLSSLTTVIDSIASTCQNVAIKLVPLVTNTGWFGLGDSPADTILAKTKEFADFFGAMCTFLSQGIIAPIAYLPKPDQIKTVAASLLATADLIKALPGWIRQIGKIAVELMADGKAVAGMFDITSFAILFGSMAQWINKGIVTPIATLPEPQIIAQGVDQLRGVIDIVQMLPQFLEDLNTAIAPLVAGSLFSSSIVKKVGGTIAVFQEYFHAIATLIHTGILRPIQQMPGEVALNIIKNQLGLLTTIITAVKVLLDAINNNLIAYCDGWTALGSSIRAIYWSMDLFGRYFQSIAAFLNKGVIEPLAQLPGQEVLEEIKTSLPLLSDIVTNVDSLLKNIDDKLVSYCDGWTALGSTIRKIWYSMDIFKEYFSAIARMLQLGIIEPVQKYIPGTQELTLVNDKLKALTDMIDLLAKTLERLSAVSSKIGSMKPGDLSKMAENVNGAMKDIGKIDTKTLATITGTAAAPTSAAAVGGPAATIPPTQTATAAAAATAPENKAWTAFREQNIPAAINPPQPSVPAYRISPPEELSPVIRAKQAAAERPLSAEETQSLVLQARKGTPKHQMERAQDLLETAAWRKKERDQRAATEWRPEGRPDYEKMYAPERAMVEATAGLGARPNYEAQYGNERAVAIGGTGSRIPEMMASGVPVPAMPVSATAVGDQYGRSIDQAPASPRSPRGAGTIQPTVQPAPLSDVYDRINRERAGAEAGAMGATASAPELAGIADSSKQQVDQLQTLHDDLSELKRLLQPQSYDRVGGNSGSPDANTRTYSKPYGATNYGKWQLSRNNNNANKQVLNDGMT